MDKDLKDFFKELKQEDQKQTIPSFDTLYPEKSTSRIRRYAVPVGVAATILLLVSPLYFTKVEDRGISSNTAVTEIIISLEPSSENKEDESIYEWEPESSFLMYDSNE